MSTQDERESVATKRRGQTVVVVEDDDDLRFLCAEVLRRAGFDVIACATLAAADVVLERVAPALVLLDRELPDGSGLELASWMRRRRTYDAVRILSFSARKSPEDIEASLAAGCDAFVAKPCAPAVLVAEVTAVLKPRARHVAPALGDSGGVRPRGMGSHPEIHVL
jgi:DNA-binding response OmpR family regulator